MEALICILEIETAHTNSKYQLHSLHSILYTSLLTMGLSHSFALLALVLVHPSAAGTNQNIVTICSAVDGTDGCTKNFNIPYDSRPLTNCKSDMIIRIRNADLIQGGNKASPCGVEILTNSENICDMINDVLPNHDFVNGYATWCLALPDALREKKAEPAIWTGGKVNGATTRAMNAIASIEKVNKSLFRLCLDRHLTPRAAIR